MMTVKEVSKLTGVSVRTLHYYDSIGLLKPTSFTQSDYRLYDDTALERLQHIMLFRELQFPLKEIKRILDSSEFDKKKAIDQQIQLLILKKEHLEGLIDFARKIKQEGVDHMDFKAFDTAKMDEYSRQAKEAWGHTDAYKEFEHKTKGVSKEELNHAGMKMMDLFVEFGKMTDQNPESEPVQGQVRKLQEYITEHFYTCTKQILSGLGQMYAAGGEMTENINRAGGDGCAEFVSKAIQIYCGK